MAELTAAERWTDEGRFSQEQMAALKLYATGLFISLEEAEREGTLPPDAEQQLYRAYFASSDQIIDYTGGYDSQIELFTLSRRSIIGRRQARNLQAGLIYNGTFGDIADSLEKAWSAQSTVEGQLMTISTLSYLM